MTLGLFWEKQIYCQRYSFLLSNIIHSYDYSHTNDHFDLSKKVVLCMKYYNYKIYITIKPLQFLYLNHLHGAGFKGLLVFFQFGIGKADTIDTFFLDSP